MQIAQLAPTSTSSHESTCAASSLSSARLSPAAACLLSTPALVCSSHQLAVPVKSTPFNPAIDTLPSARPPAPVPPAIGLDWIQLGRLFSLWSLLVVSLDDGSAR